MTRLLLKRAYDAASDTDGFRVYVDRLWPQGLSHARFPYDVWDKQIAPSPELRERFHTDRDANWNAFKKAYREELVDNPVWPDFVKSLEAHEVVTLLYSSKNETENNAVVLRDTLIDLFPSKFSK